MLHREAVVAEFDKAQNDAEIALFVAVEALLSAKREQRDWNPSTTADEICDLVVNAGWTPST